MLGEILATHEQLRANIDAGHTDQWPMYIDACLDAGVPVLMDSFECEKWGVVRLQAGAELGLWRQEPIWENGYFHWFFKDKKTDSFWIAYSLSSEARARFGRFKNSARYTTTEEAKADLLRAMVEWCREQL